MELSLPVELAEFVARLVDQGRYADEGDVIRDAVRRLEHQTPAEPDVEALAFLVLMEAAKSARE